MKKTPFQTIGIIILLIAIVAVWIIRKKEKEKKNPISSGPSSSSSNSKLLNFIRNRRAMKKPLSNKTKTALNLIKGFNWEYLPSDFVAAQFLHESNYGKSRLYNEQNNLFGMRCVKERQNTQTGCENDYGVYNSDQDSIADLKLWLDNAILGDARVNVAKKYGRPFANRRDLMNPTFIQEVKNEEIAIKNKIRSYNIDQYAEFLKQNNYFEDTLSNYANGLNNAINTLA